MSGDRAALVAAARLAADGNKELTGLHAQMTTQAADLKALKDAAARSASEAYVDGQMAQKRMGLKASNREEFVALHMSQPEMCKKIVEGMPLGGETHTHQIPAAQIETLSGNLKLIPDYGVTLVPRPHLVSLREDQRALFERYGYRFDDKYRFR